MNRIYVFILLTLIAIIGVSYGGSTRADAHGLGGLDATQSNSKVQSIKPNTSDFKVLTIENGEKVLVERTGSKDVIVIGVDDEQYLLLNSKGVFVNLNSATRLINDEKTENYSPERIREVFGKTSSDPNVAPKWEKISSSNSHAWHDHRSHYMGDVPSGVTDLGTNTFPIVVGDTKHVVTFEMYAKAQSSWLLNAAIVTAIALLMIYALYKNQSVVATIFRPCVLATLSLIVVLLQLVHLYGYVSFSQEPILESIGQSVYSIAVVAIFSFLAYVGFTQNNIDSRTFWNKHAPLLCVAGVTGFIAGALIEFATLVQPFPASTLNLTFLRFAITFVAAASILLLSIGAFNVKPDHTLNLEKEQSDSLA